MRPGGYVQRIGPDHLSKLPSLLTPSSATSVLHKLFDFAKRRAVELHWDHETRFARNLRQLLIDDPSMESVREEVLAIDASFSPHSYNGSIAVWWMTNFCCAQWTMRIVY